MKQAHPTIIYIVGRGHSGSTLLDLLISSHSAVTSIGEIKMVSVARRERDDPTRLDVLRQPCTCGAKQVLDCPFWQHVDQVLQQRHGLSLATLDVESSDDETFLLHSQILYRAVQQCSGQQFLVDSSKNFKRLARLAASKQLDLRVVYLLRHPLGVVHSNVKRGRDWEEETLGWLRKTLKTQQVLAHIPHYTVRYEDLARAPRKTMQGVMAWLGLRLEDPQLVWPEHEHHMVYGNDMRLHRDPEIRLRTGWKSGLTSRQKLLIRWMTLPARLNREGLYEACPPLWEFRGFKKWVTKQWKERRHKRAKR